MYAYCSNNPVNREDDTGDSWEDWWIVKRFREFRQKNKNGKNLSGDGSSDYKGFKKAGSAVKTGIKVTKQEDLYKHAKNVHDTNYCKKENIDFNPKSPNILVFGMGKQYDSHCENIYESYNQFAEGCDFNIKDRPWKDLSDYEKDVMARGITLWDPSCGLGYKYHTAFEGGLGLAK